MNTSASLPADESTPSIIYCRVSSDRQAKEGSGLGSQEQRCRSYALARGYGVLATFSDEGVSGALLNRPGVRALLSFLCSQLKGTVVIVDDISRIARDMRTHLELRAAISAAGGQLESPSMRFEESAAGEFIEMVLAASAQFGRQGNREQVLNRQKARLQMGYWTFPAPLGYAYTSHPVHKKIIAPTEEGRRILGSALEAFAFGRIGSQRALALHLQDKGFFPSAKRRREGIGTLEKRVGRLLDARRLYAGLLDYPSWNIHDVVAQHEPIISHTILLRLEQRLDAKAPVVIERADARSEFPLRGFARCRECGRPLTGCLAKGKYARYFCYAQGKCSRYGWSFSAGIMEPQFEELLHSITPRDKTLEVMRTLSTTAWRKRIANKGLEQRALEQEVEKHEDEVAALVRRLGKTTDDDIALELEKEVKALKHKRAQVVAKLQELDEKPRDYEAAWNRVSTWLRDPGGQWKSGSLNQKKTVHRLVFDSAPAFDRIEGFSTYDLTLPYLVSGTLEGSSNGLVEVTGESWHQFTDSLFTLDARLHVL